MQSPDFFDIEESITPHHRLFQHTELTLDDLDVYAEPAAAALNLINRIGNGVTAVTDEEIVESITSAGRTWMQIDEALELADVA